MQEYCKAGSGEPASAASAVSTDSGKLKEKRRELEWLVRYNSALCDDYAGFYSFCDKACTSIVAMFGTYTFVSAFVGLSRFYAVVSVIVSALSVISLVAGFSSKNYAERSRKLRYDAIIAEINQAKDLAQLEDIERKLADPSFDEPKRNEIARAVAYNEAAGQMGCSESYNVEIGWFKWITRFIIPWRRPSYKVLQNAPSAAQD